MKGLRNLYNYGNDSLSITDLLEKPDIVNYLGQGKTLTYASLREKLRGKLKKLGSNLKEIVGSYNLENPVGQGQQQRQQRDTLYGAQRVKKGLAKKDTRGRVIGGPRVNNRPPPRNPRVPILINGERLTARQALEKYPQLKKFLDPGERISKRSLHAKYRAWMKKGKIPDEIIDPEPEIVPRGRLLGSNVLGQYTIHAKVSTSPRDFLDRAENVVVKFLGEHPQNKVQLSLVCIMVRFDPTTGNVIAEEPAHFNSAMEIVYGATDLQGVYERARTKILESFSTYLKNGSAWVLKKVVRLDITLAKFRPMKGSSYIPLPNAVRNKGAVINMKNEDEYCFKWAVTRALNPVEKHPERITEELREQAEELNWAGIIFPTPCSEKYFEKFGRNNNVSVLAFGYDDDEGKIIPLYVPRVMREKVIRLFFQRNEDGKKWHYGAIKSMSRLVSMQKSKKRVKKFVCDYCVNVFGSEEVLGKHLAYCSEHDAVKVKMRAAGRNTLKFKNIQNMVECPVKIMFDFESFLEKSDKVSGSTELYQKHKPSAFCIYAVSRVEGFAMAPITHVCENEDEDVSKVFAEELEKITKNIYERFKEPKKMVFDENARKLHDSQHACYACGEKFKEVALPVREKFSSVLNSGEIVGSGKGMEPAEISEADYEHAQNVYKVFGCKNLAEYTSLYCKSDVLLLADVWESFVSVCLEKYGLDQSHYITSPSLFNDAMLKMTGVKLELLTDNDMYLFYEKGVRGGISTVMGRYARANNPYMEDYDPSVPTSYIQYLDANNLYGWAMSQLLPVGGFEWLPDGDIES